MTLSGQSAGGSRPLGAEIAGAIAWWREAGVDCEFSDEAHNWLASSEPEAAAPPAIQPPTPQQAPAPYGATVAPTGPIGGERALWPQRLDEFAAWWLGETSLDSGPLDQRIAPAGPAGAELMVLVDHPEDGDSAALLEGPQGRLLDAILRAIGLDRGKVYLASALPRHAPMPDWQALGAAGLGAVLAHHVVLAAPRRLLVFGSHVSSLLGHDPAKITGFLPNLQLEGRSADGAASVPALVAPGLAALGARPRGKARLWQALLDWGVG